MEEKEPFRENWCRILRVIFHGKSTRSKISITELSHIFLGFMPRWAFATSAYPLPPLWGTSLRNSHVYRNNFMSSSIHTRLSPCQLHICTVAFYWGVTRRIGPFPYNPPNPVNGLIPQIKWGHASHVIYGNLTLMGAFQLKTVKHIATFLFILKQNKKKIRV